MSTSRFTWGRVCAAFEVIGIETDSMLASQRPGNVSVEKHRNNFTKIPFDTVIVVFVVVYYRKITNNNRQNLHRHQATAQN